MIVRTACLKAAFAAACVSSLGRRDCIFKFFRKPRRRFRSSTDNAAPYALRVNLAGSEKTAIVVAFSWRVAESRRWAVGRRVKFMLSKTTPQRRSDCAMNSRARTRASFVKPLSAVCIALDDDVEFDIQQ
jgi:hypothetical protein